MFKQLLALPTGALMAWALLASYGCGDPYTAPNTPAQAACMVDCDCAQGQLCSAGQCKDGAGSLFCCEKAGCEPGARCVDRQGIASTCLECVVNCDCPQGQACEAGQCKQTASPTYCCDKEQCPVNVACTDLEGAAGVCPPECVVDCDCPQGQACSSSGLCLDTSPPTYCCAQEACPEGEVCSKPDGTSGSCPKESPVDPVCGNGAIEEGERCDGNCPTSCDDQNACTKDTILGANTCQAECRNTPVTACSSGDGCCPSGCDFDSDDDCPNPQSCGNGTIEEGERCDGDCPTSCDDQDACTSDALTGSAAQCTAQCTFTTINACKDGDGCCPSGCSSANDDDCEPPAPSGEVGSACTQDNQCQGLRSGCITQASSPIYRDGYCTKTCIQDAECGAGSHCSYDRQQCLKSCGQDSDCRAGYICYDDDYDFQKECLPSQGAPGDACSNDNQCHGADATCYLAADGIFNGGYCSKPCSILISCGEKGHCLNNGSGAMSTCVANCNSDSDCRGQGYACLDNDNDGYKECIATNNGPGTYGDACAGIWDCGGTTPECATNIPNIGYLPGGYCTTPCEMAIANSCPSGYMCVGVNTLPPFILGDGYCIETCTQTSQCRSGYTCRDFNDGFNPVVKVCLGT